MDDQILFILYILNIFVGRIFRAKKVCYTGPKSLHLEQIYFAFSSPEPIIFFKNQGTAFPSDRCIHTYICIFYDQIIEVDF